SPDPAAALLERVRRTRAFVRDRFSPDRLNGCRPADVRRVLVIDSASRCGSSFLHYLLSRHLDVLSLNGEGSVFERLHGVGVARSADDSDFLPDDGTLPSAVPAAIAEDVLLDAGAPGPAADGFRRDHYLADCVQRLTLQYAESDFDAERARAVCDRALGAAGAPGAPFEAAEYWRRALRGLRELPLPADPARYDLRGSDPTADFPEAGNVLPPSFSEFALEDPPFVVPRPRALPRPRELGSKTLLLKSSSDCYRMWLVRRLFPNAEFRFVVLTRNPAAAISGLADGWLSDGFYSQNVGRFAPLDISGYSRADRPWTRTWWNFDLPPGWAGLRGGALEDVCAHQWASANEHILRDSARGVVDDALRVRYESFLEAASLSRELGRIFEFAGLDPARALDRGAAPVMSVTPPAPQKWRKRRDALAPRVAGARVAELARELGYDPSRWEEWA
ncbi:MAG TPA: hypothetical protein VN915_00730, partial [Elusimicrobiota bacterium]|nr:hypothetical protein [Elusimicrobiota bacterium]